MSTPSNHVTPTPLQDPPGNARLEMLQATLQHAVENTAYYRQAFAGLDLTVGSLEGLQRFPLLSRNAFAKYGTELLVAGAVPEYVGLTSGTTFDNNNGEPLLHYQTEEEHTTWASLYESLAGNASGDRPLMLRLIDADRGVEVAGAFPGCFSLPLQTNYHFELICSVLQREWSFAGFSRRVVSLSGPLDKLQLLTLLSIDHGLDPAQVEVGLITTSGWQVTTRWRRLLENYWNAEVQELYGLSEAPGMFATRCRNCSHYHFSPLSVIEILRLHDDQPAKRGLGRVVVTCLLPLAYAQPLIRYDTGDVIDVLGECANRMAFEYIGRRSKLVFSQAANHPLLLLSPLMLTELLDSLPDVAFTENAISRSLGLRAGFGWPLYSLTDTGAEPDRRIQVNVGLHWSPLHYPEAARHFCSMLHQRILDAAPALAATAREGAIRFEIHLLGPGEALYGRCDS